MKLHAAIKLCANCSAELALAKIVLTSPLLAGDTAVLVRKWQAVLKKCVAWQDSALGNWRLLKLPGGASCTRATKVTCVKIVADCKQTSAASLVEHIGIELTKCIQS